MNQLEDVKQVTVRLPIAVKAYLDGEVARNRSSQSSEVIRLLRDRMASEAREKAAANG